MVLIESMLGRGARNRSWECTMSRGNSGEVAMIAIAYRHILATGLGHGESQRQRTRHPRNGGEEASGDAASVDDSAQWR